MEQSILNSVKQVLGLAAEYTPFDQDIQLHINSAITSLYQLGLGPTTPITVDGAEVKWEQLELTERELNQVKPYIYLKVRMLFDPPTLGYLISAFERQITELEWRLSNFRESTPDSHYDSVSSEEEVVI